MKRVVFASNNAGKVREVAAMLEGVGIELVPQSEFGVPSVEETGLSFVENALLKARHAAQLTGLPAIADDSGLEVDALDGAPGIYSARYAGAEADDATNNTKLLAALRDVPAEQRTARFQSLMVFLRHPLDPTPLICQGTWQGLIAQTSAGSAGFGYDPLFQVPEFNCTAAELDPATKNQLSHRGQALRCLLQALGNRR
jgi:XTP/dITP diphosphohydrolase